MGCFNSKSRVSLAKYDYLCATPLYLRLNEEQLQSFSELFTLQKYHPGTKLVRQGEAVDKFYVIGKGSVVLQVDRGPDNTTGSSLHLETKAPIEQKDLPAGDPSMSRMVSHDAASPLLSAVPPTGGAGGAGAGHLPDTASTEHTHHPPAEFQVEQTADESKDPLNGHASVYSLGPGAGTSSSYESRGSALGFRRKASNENRPSVLASLSAGAFFNHIGILTDGALSTHNVSTFTDCELMWVSKKTLEKYLQQRRDVLPLLLSSLDDSLEQQLKELALFRGVPDSRVRLVASMLHYVPLGVDEVLFSEGDVDEDGNSMYIVYEGACKAVTYDNAGNEVLLNSFKKGQFFGEIGLMIDIPRTATVVGTEKCLLLELCKNEFQNFLQINTDPQLEVNLNIIMKKRTAEHFRKYNVPFFAAIPDDKYAVLASMCTIETFPENTAIFCEGEVGRAFYLIAHGTVKLSCLKKRKDGQLESIELCRLGPGAYFGESALVKGSIRNATVTTTSRCVLVVIADDHFRQFFQQVPEAVASFQVRLAKYRLNLSTLVHHSLGIEYFRRHLEREFSLENWEFYQATKNFKDRYEPLFAPPSTLQRSLSRILPATDHDTPTDDLVRQEWENVEARPARATTVLKSEAATVSTPPTKEEMLADAKNLVNTFIADASPKMVNLQGARRDAILAKLRAEESNPGSITPDLFTAANKEIFDLMETDSLQRFKSSELFHEYLDENDKQSAQALENVKLRESGEIVRSPSFRLSRVNSARRTQGRASNIIDAKDRILPNQMQSAPHDVAGTGYG